MKKKNEKNEQEISKKKKKTKKKKKKIQKKKKKTHAGIPRLDHDQQLHVALWLQEVQWFYDAAPPLLCSVILQFFLDHRQLRVP